MRSGWPGDSCPAGDSTEQLSRERTVIRMAFSVQLDYRIAEPCADFILNIQAAHRRQQWLINESLQISRSVTMHSFTDLATQTRQLPADQRRAGGPYRVVPG